MEILWLPIIWPSWHRRRVGGVRFRHRWGLKLLATKLCSGKASGQPCIKSGKRPAIAR